MGAAPVWPRKHNFRAQQVLPSVRPSAHPRAGHEHVLAALRGDQLTIPAHGIETLSLTVTPDMHRPLCDANGTVLLKISK